MAYSQSYTAAQIAAEKLRRDQARKNALVATAQLASPVTRAQATAPRPSPDAKFFAANAVAKGQPVNPMDIDPDTGRVGNPLDTLRAQDAIKQKSRADRIARSRNGGMELNPQPGRAPRPATLGVDAIQSQEMKEAEDAKNNAFFLQARVARQKDPLAGHETEQQFAANNAKQDPTGVFRTARRTATGALNPAAPVVPAPRPPAAPAAPVAGPLEEGDDSDDEDDDY